MCGAQETGLAACQAMGASSLRAKLGAGKEEQDLASSHGNDFQPANPFPSHRVSVCINLGKDARGPYLGSSEFLPAGRNDIQCG